MSIIWNIIYAFFAPLTGFVEAMRLKKFRIHTDISNEIWVFEAVPNFAYLYRYYYYLKACIRAGQRPKVIWFNTTMFFRKNRFSFKTRLMDRVTQNNYTQQKWKWVYSAIFPGKWLSTSKVFKSAENSELAKKLFTKLKTKEDLEKLMIGDFWAGDLIYDTYLRFKPAATVDVQDPFVLELIEKSINVISQITQVYEDQKIARLITSYSSYIQHGLMVRVALNRGIPVQVMPGDHQLIAGPDLSFPYHTRNLRLYREWFKKVENKEAALESGKKMIEARLSGQVDATNAYMKQSSFSNDPNSKLHDDRLDERPKVVFMSHDFFDSPHSFGDMLYTDFFEWLNVCLEWAKDSPYQFVVKPHPNGIPENEAIVPMLQNRFKDVVFLDKKTPNGLIAKLPIVAVVTVYGTIAHEFAALGHPVVCCGVNPHSSFSFCNEPKTRQELEDILKGKVSLSSKIDLKEIYEFMYVHNYRILNDEDLFSIFLDYPDCLRDFGKDGIKQMDLIDRELKNLNSL